MTWRDAATGWTVAEAYECGRNDERIACGVPNPDGIKSLVRAVTAYLRCVGAVEGYKLRQPMLDALRECGVRNDPLNKASLT